VFQEGQGLYMTDSLIKSAKALKGTIAVPGDKSISHRALMLSAIGRGKSRITNFLEGEDCISTLNAMRSAGVEIDYSKEEIVVQGVGLNGLKEPRDVIDAGNSGTTTRLLTGLFAGQDFFTVITGDNYLRKRPMKRVVDPLSQMGARIWGREGGEKLPLAINGAALKGIDYHSPIASAQVKSSIILAGLRARGITRVYEPSLSRDHTERMLHAMGARCAVLDNNGFEIEGGVELGSADVTVPGDISSAAFFIVAALIIEGSQIELKNVGINPTRTGIVDILREMGGDIKYEKERDVAGEPVADIIVSSSKLKAVEVGGDVIPRAIDEIPLLAVAAAFAEGRTKVTDAKELRVKECDRISAMTLELKKLGISIEELEDGFVIDGSEQVMGASVAGHGDHRIAMSMAVAGLIATGETLINGSDCVNVSFPGFFDLLEFLRGGGLRC